MVKYYFTDHFTSFRNCCCACAAASLSMTATFSMTSTGMLGCWRALVKSRRLLPPHPHAHAPFHWANSSRSEKAAGGTGRGWPDLGSPEGDKSATLDNNTLLQLSHCAKYWLLLLLLLLWIYKRSMGQLRERHECSKKRPIYDTISAGAEKWLRDSRGIAIYSNASDQSERVVIRKLSPVCIDITLNVWYFVGVLISYPK